jgi:pyocin large subunit-like protein
VLSKTRANGDVVRFDPASNAFGVMDKTGAPRTFYVPDPTKHGYPTNLDYFHAQ